MADEVGGVKVRHEDGLKGLLKCLPPAQPRLLALIDPSYEIKTDYEAVARTLMDAWKKCRHGVYLIWYPPLLTSGLEQKLMDSLRASGSVRKILQCEVMLDQPPERGGMVGSGMLIVNPPWGGFDERFAAMMSDLTGPIGSVCRLPWIGWCLNRPGVSPLTDNNQADHPCLPGG